MSYIAGIDLGSAHIKYCIVNVESKRSETGTIPLWIQSRDKIEVIKNAFSFLIENKLREYKIKYIGIVSSFEATFIPDPDKCIKIQKAILDTAEEKGYELYSINHQLKLVNLIKEEWIPLSVIYSIGYIASLILKAGLLIHMNSASTVIAPVKNHKYVSINPHKYTSGEAAWIGALLTPLSSISQHGLMFGNYCNLSPYGAYTGDVINVLFQKEFRKILEKLNASVKIDYKKSVGRFLQLLGQLQNSNGIYNFENQVKISALMFYYDLLNKIRRMVFQVMSSIDANVDNMKFIVSGIGKDLVLKKVLSFTKNVYDIEEYLDPEICVNLESFGIIAAITKHKFDVNIIKYDDGELK